MQEIKINPQLTWLSFNVEDLRNTSELATYGIDLETLQYAEDKNERPHTEFIPDSQDFVLIFNSLDLLNSEVHYKTVPITFVAQKNRLITLYHPENEYLINQIKKYCFQNKPETVYHLLFISLFLISEAFFPYLEQIDKSKEEINQKLREKTTKKNLLALSDIETGMLYIVSSANQNTLLLEQLKTKSIYRQFNETEKEQLEDAIIEAQQLASMTHLNAQILEQLAGTYNNVLNNNLNDNMTTLTIVSVLLAGLAVITGFFGMNVPLPLTNQKDAWVWIIGACIILWLLYAALFRYIIGRRQ